MPDIFPIFEYKLSLETLGKTRGGNRFQPMLMTFRHTVQLSFLGMIYFGMNCLTLGHAFYL